MKEDPGSGALRRDNLSNSRRITRKTQHLVTSSTRHSYDSPAFALAQSPILSALPIVFSLASISSIRLSFADLTTFVVSPSLSAPSLSLSSLESSLSAGPPADFLRNIDPFTFFFAASAPAPFFLSSSSLLSPEDEAVSSSSLDSSSLEDESESPLKNFDPLALGLDVDPAALGLAALDALSVEASPASDPLSSSDELRSSSSLSLLDSESLPAFLKKDLLMVA